MCVCCFAGGRFGPAFRGDNNLSLCAFPTGGGKRVGCRAHNLPRRAPARLKACQQHTKEIKLTSTHSGDNQYSQLLSYIQSLLGATHKGKPLRKAPEPGETDRARPRRVPEYADWRSSASALSSDEGARRESARTSPPPSMAASPAWPTLGPWLHRLSLPTTIPQTPPALPYPGERE